MGWDREQVYVKDLTGFDQKSYDMEYINIEALV